MRGKILGMALLVSPLGLAAAPLAHATQPDTAQSNTAQSNTTQSDTMKCTMHFTLSGWSAIYQTANGKGTVECANGETMKVDINAKGGGLSVGKYKLDNGVGHFSGVKSIDDVIGAYAQATSHAGVVGSSRAAAMTKGNVSLAITGTGKGWDIGAGFNSFSIKRQK
jgi:hypothetical protein